jgi:trans-L-3-hydroxyproline dehydratase
MDIDPTSLLAKISRNMSTSTLDMHSTGEAIRIIFSGPDVQGTLLDQRSTLQQEHDNFRRQIILEPRGHRDMYGAYLRPTTEFVETEEADIGVIFMSNAGYPSMCGHAIIALGRLLVDLDDPVFFQRNKLVYDAGTQSVNIRLHAPCGLISIKVWTLEDGKKSDPNKPVSFYSVPSFVTGIDQRVPIPANLRWPELGNRTEVTVDVSYGGAFFCIVLDSELGFQPNLENANRVALDAAARNLKTAITMNRELRHLYSHPESERLSTLYGIMVVDTKKTCMMDLAPGTQGCETGLCFFANGQVDRSPCGGGVAARVMLAYVTSQRGTMSWTYHSLVSNAFGGFSGSGSFVGRAMLIEEPVELEDGREVESVTIKVKGSANYTGTHLFFVEDGDEIGKKGFSMYNGKAFVKPLPVRR